MMPIMLSLERGQGRLGHLLASCCSSELFSVLFPPFNDGNRELLLDFGAVVRATVVGAEGDDSTIRG